jgi:hypothetical protein
VPGTCWGGVVQPSLPALDDGLPGAWHLLGRLARETPPPSGDRWLPAVCPVPGTCRGGAVQPGLPALDGRSARCLAPFGGAWHFWGRLSHPLPSGGRRREKRLHRLATGGYALTGGYPRTGGYARTGGYRPDRWLPPGLQLTHSVRIANLDA